MVTKDHDDPIYHNVQQYQRTIQQKPSLGEEFEFGIHKPSSERVILTLIDFLMQSPSTTSLDLHTMCNDCYPDDEQVFNHLFEKLKDKMRSRWKELKEFSTKFEWFHSIPLPPDHGPWDVKICFSYGCILVTDFYTFGIRVFDLVSKEFKTTIALPACPTCVCVEEPLRVTSDSTALIFGCSKPKVAVYKYEMRKLLNARRTPTTRNACNESPIWKTTDFKWPYGIAIWRSENQVFVCDVDTKSVKILNSQSGLLLTSIQLQFRCCSVDLASDRELVVSAGNQLFIFKQSLSGEWEQYKNFSRLGSEEGSLDGPFSLVVDKKTKNIMVSDCNNHRINVFTLEGEFVKSFGSRVNTTPTNEYFCFPRGICLNDRTGDLLVADRDSFRIQFFK
ncbi:hypothetical protein C9374_010585 [Naegleria lovaniensis]|uniref:Uncharacterized protein n=1 Tax=Naegleria lovaniensis TaxID=51637 RepID=A0AA88GI48_NAELO|nr:uncharacterized protein C9374_010585 [Naegleria lovaniensis]KAG2374566.1 hypothetical protein C9374_010585 [Naegleria lovaniensis]